MTYKALTRNTRCARPSSRRLGNPDPERGEQVFELGELLEMEFESELIREFVCEECDTKGCFGWKFQAMAVEPEVLALQIRRFRSFVDGRTVRLKTHVQINHEGHLRLPTCMAGQGSSRYLFRAVVIHLGDSLEVGHYITCFRSKTNGHFYEADDGRITEIANPADYFREERILGGAYLLWYERD